METYLMIEHEGLTSCDNGSEPHRPLHSDRRVVQLDSASSASESMTMASPILVPVGPSSVALLPSRLTGMLACFDFREGDRPDATSRE